MRNFKILHVDDDTMMRDIVGSLLAKDPELNVRSCDSGEEGLATSFEWLPNLILCDVVMPTMSGDEMLRRLRGEPQTADIPVIFTTARTEIADIEKWIALGVSDVISKPFKPKSLLKIVREHLGAADDYEDSEDVSVSGLDFRGRLTADAGKLGVSLSELKQKGTPSEGLRSTLHQLAGAAALYGYEEIGAAAARAEEVICTSPPGDMPKLTMHIETLLSDIESALDRPSN